jgi:hypothetical protein
MGLNLADFQFNVNGTLRTPISKAATYLLVSVLCQFDNGFDRHLCLPCTHPKLRYVNNTISMDGQDSFHCA